MNIKNRLIEIFLKKKHFFTFPEILAMNQKEQLHSIQQLSTKLNFKTDITTPEKLLQSQGKVYRMALRYKIFTPKYLPEINLSTGRSL